ncbi:MAG: peptidylprolyl isomerase [Bacteroidales bacterium]|nr:peptidylprolyl isomerase [Bacteroidales bacterium]
MKKILFLSLAVLCISCVGAQNDRTRVKISTTKGDIVIELYNETPIHRDNFIKLVEDNFFDGLLFHRCIRDFMIQGGDPDSRNAQPGQMLGAGNIGYTLEAEFVPELIHTRGALAAARTGDHVNPERRSSGSQFYIVQGRTFTQEQMEAMNLNRYPQWTAEQIELYTIYGGTPHLDMLHTVFGRVVSGLDVVEAISLVPTDQSNRPLEDISMTMRIIR